MNDINTCKYVNLEDIQKLLHSYDCFDDHAFAADSRNFDTKWLRYRSPCDDGLNVDVSSKLSGNNERYPITPARTRQSIKPQRLLSPYAVYPENPSANFTSHSAPHSPLHQSYDSFTNFKIYARRTSRTRSPHVRIEIPQYERLRKYSFTNAIDRKTNDQTKSQKWGSLDYSANRRDGSLTVSAAYGSMHRHVLAAHDEDRRAQQDADTFQLGNHNTASIKHKKPPDKGSGDANKNCSRGAEEGMTILADRKQKKKIMSNYLVIRALLSSTEGKLSDGECHPLLSVNTV